jgi:hypothetical protein
VQPAIQINTSLPLQKANSQKHKAKQTNDFSLAINIKSPQIVQTDISDRKHCQMN